MEPWISHGTVRCLDDIKKLEQINLEARFDSWDINDWILAGLERDPSKTAIAYFTSSDFEITPQQLTYADVRRSVIRVSNLLAQLGVKKGDAIVLMAPIVPDVHIVLLAALASGICCPVNWMLGPNAVAELIAKSKAKVVIALGPTPGFTIWEQLQSVGSEILDRCPLLSIRGPGGTEVPNCDLMQLSCQYDGDHFLSRTPRSRDDIVAYIHSGGTTGIPKLVQLESGAFVHKCWTATMTMAYQPENVLVSDMPLFHIAGFVTSGVLPFILGCTLAVPSIHGARDREYLKNYWNFVEKMKVSFVHAVPATLSTLVQHPPNGQDISSLRPYTVTGSTGLPIEVAVKFEQNTGIRILSTYGATEFCMNVTQSPRDGEPRYGSAGIRNPDTEIKIVKLDREGQVLRECEVDEVGAVIVRSPGTTPGYLGLPPERSFLLGNKWINNGDLGRLDRDGYLWLTGRAKDLIIRSGHNIDPSIIEQALYKHPDVIAAAAVGKPDEYAGELPIAYVQLAEHASVRAEELIAFVRRAIADPVAAPREVLILQELPLTDIRKIDKIALREDAATRVFEERLRIVLSSKIRYAISHLHDPQLGAVTVICLSGIDVSEQVEMVRVVEDVMKRFAVQFRITVA